MSPVGLAKVSFTHPLFSWREGGSTLSYGQRATQELPEIFHAIL